MITVREVLTRLREDGWQIVRQRGSHRQLHHPLKPGTVTVAGHPGDSVPAWHLPGDSEAGPAEGLLMTYRQELARARAHG